MLKSLEEINEVDIEAGVVVNGVDNPNMLSVDSTEPVKTTADDVDEKVKSEDEKIPAEEKKVEVKAEKEKEEKGEVKPKSKTESNPDSPKVAKRIGDLTKKYRTAERERDFERDKRLEAEAKLLELTSKISDGDKPVKIDFDDEDDYIEALTDWKIDAKLKASQASVTKEIEDKDERLAVAETYNGLDDALERGREKYEDFNTLVLDENLIISPEVTQIILDTEISEDIMYHLAKNPDESERISSLSPTRAAKEIGKLEVKLTKEIEAKVEKKEEKNPEVKPKTLKKQSNAPEPIVPVTTTGITEKDPNKMTPKEYRAWREAQAT